MPRLPGIVAVMLLAAGCAAQPLATASDAGSPEAPSGSAPASSEGEPTSSESAAPHVTPIPDAPASDVVVVLSALGGRWDVDSLTAPAGMTWTLEFHNLEEGDEHEEHNFTIADGPEFADRIFQTPNLVGPATESYEIPALPAGTYDFVCTRHPDTMTGTLVIE